MITLEWTPLESRPRKVEFEPQSDGTWLRCEYERRNGSWRLCGCEPLESLTLDQPDTDATLTTCRGEGDA
ncbi:hypothetical protein ACLI4Y_16555 [Natrialbaceae archaeon A-CW3]